MSDLTKFENCSVVPSLKEENTTLKHDIEQHVKICADLATENERLRALLARARDVFDTANNTYLGSEYIYAINPDAVENIIQDIDAELKGE